MISNKLKMFYNQTQVIKEQGWNGLKNGMLLQKLLEDNFNGLITFDKNLQHQQNFKTYPITVFLLKCAELDRT